MDNYYKGLLEDGYTLDEIVDEEHVEEKKEDTKSISADSDDVEFADAVKELKYQLKFNEFSRKYIKVKIFKEKDIENNKISVVCLYKEIKRVNFKVFIYLKYDHSIDFLSTFPLELQSLMQDIMQLEKCDSTITIPNVIPIQELIKETDMTVIDAQLQENYQLMNDFILDYKLII